MATFVFNLALEFIVFKYELISHTKTVKVLILIVEIRRAMLEITFKTTIIKFEHLFAFKYMLK